MSLKCSIIICHSQNQNLEFVLGYAYMYKVDHSILSLPLSSLFESTCLNMSYTDLLVKCENVFQDLTISKQQCKNIEVSTRDQAQYPYLEPAQMDMLNTFAVALELLKLNVPFLPVTNPY